MEPEPARISAAMPMVASLVALDMSLPASIMDAGVYYPFLIPRKRGKRPGNGIWCYGVGEDTRSGATD